MMNRHSHIFQLASFGEITNAIGDYSSVDGSFRITATANQHMAIRRLIVSIEDAGISNYGEYGAIAALSNGVRIYLRNESDALIEEITSFAIKTNGNWGAHCYDTKILGNPGAGNDYVSVRWTFEESGKPILLDGGDYLEVLLSDNFAGLVSQTFIFQGYYLDPVYSRLSL